MVVLLINMVELLKQTNAYKVLLSEKKANSLSHAYLVDCGDEKMLRTYLKNFAKLILCEEDGEFCDNCRVCRLIERETHPDVSIYPREGEKLKVEVCDEIVSLSIVRPLEISKRLFVISDFQKLLRREQNKLLKTLEEPPENVILLIGTSNINSILPTVKSRTKHLEIPPFSDEALFNAFSKEMENKEKLDVAIALSRGYESGVIENYNKDDFIKLKNLATQTLKNLNSSRDALSVAKSLENVNVSVFVNILKLIFREILKGKNGAISRLISENDLNYFMDKYSMGCVVSIIEGIGEIERSLYFNANNTMCVYRLLFLILEARHKWQKL